jgi:N-acetyl-beta-hexosaminidase
VRGEDVTYKFVEDVVASIGSITPGEYFHVGGDEVKAWTRALRSVHERIQKIVEAHGKRMIGWSEIALANLPGSVIVQSWIRILHMSRWRAGRKSSSRRAAACIWTCSTTRPLRSACIGLAT